MVRLLPIALLLGLAAADGEGESVPAALVADDECEQQEDGQCVLHALQHAGRTGALVNVAKVEAAQQPKGADGVEPETADNVVTADDMEPEIGEASEGMDPEDVIVGEASTAVGGPGIVSAVYTFGAPATSSEPFRDLARPDGIFQGLRVYTENIFGATGESKQIDGGALFGSYSHPKLATMALHWGRDSYYVPGEGRPDWPMGGAAVYVDWGLHNEHHYTDRLAHLTLYGRPSGQAQPFSTALKMAFLAFAAYDRSTYAFKEVVRNKLPGHIVVARETQNTLEAKDNVWIVQEKADKSCTLVFTGTSNPGELSTSITSYATGYCGYPRVHVGYRNKLWWLTNGLWSRIRPKLAKCSRVTCTGHSLGGSLCDVFSACANSRRSSDPDYIQQMWVQGAPELMPEV